MSITMIGLDTAKSVFQVHAVDETGKLVIRRKLRRNELIAFFEKQEACTVVMEACGAAHHWARVLTGLGHDVKLIAPEAVRPFVKKGKKNDAADAAAICEAASRPGMRFVPIKSLAHLIQDMAGIRRRVCNRGRSPGNQAGVAACRTRSGSGGMLTAPGTCRRSPR